MLNTFELMKHILATLEAERSDDMAELANRLSVCSISIELDRESQTIVATNCGLRLVDGVQGQVSIKSTGNNLQQLLLGNISLIVSLEQERLTVIGSLENLGVAHDVFLVLLNLTLASSRSAELYERWSQNEIRTIHRGRYGRQEQQDSGSQ